jgi:hypothetical protein
MKERLATYLAQLRMPFRPDKERTQPYVRAGIVLTQELVTSLHLVGWKDFIPSYTTDEVAAIERELCSWQRIANNVAEERWGPGRTMVVHPSALPEIQRMCAATALKDLAYYQWFWEDELPRNWKDFVSTYLKAWAAQFEPDVLLQLANLLLRAKYRNAAKQAYQVVLLFPTYADTFLGKHRTPEVVDGIVNQAKKALQDLQTADQNP